MKLLYALMGGLMLWSSLAHGHLLNMTRVQITIEQSGALHATIDADLTKALAGGEAYYTLSQLAQPATSPVFKRVLDDLMSASVITLGGQPLSWEFDAVDMPDNPREDFVSGLAWPMTRFYFSAQLPKGFKQQIMMARFSDRFKFEEPIAVNIAFANEAVTLSRWLVRNQQSPDFAFVPQEATSVIDSSDIDLWLSYLKQGVLHIVPFGWDHALFVLGLFLGVRSLRQLAWLISGFTLAHTVTLGLATYGAIVVSGSIIEPVIALSIAWIALENLLFAHRLWWRFIVVFAFGLVHGLGFAQALKALGIPSSGYVGALVSFNIGVELAQLGIIILAYALVVKWRYHELVRTRISQAGSTGIAMVALYWFIQRVWF